jgi:hypothetical protein
MSRRRRSSTSPTDVVQSVNQKTTVDPRLPTPLTPTTQSSIMRNSTYSNLPVGDTNIETYKSWLESAKPILNEWSDKRRVSVILCGVNGETTIVVGVPSKYMDCKNELPSTTIPMLITAIANTMPFTHNGLPSFMSHYIQKPFTGCPIGIGNETGTLGGYINIGGQTYGMSCAHVGGDLTGVSQPVYGMTIPLGRVQARYVTYRDGTMVDWLLYRSSPERIGFNNQFGPLFTEGDLVPSEDDEIELTRYCFQGAMSGIQHLTLNKVELCEWTDRVPSMNRVSIPCNATKGDSGAWLFNQNNQVCGILVGGHKKENNWIVFADMKTTLNDIAQQLKVERSTITFAQ